MNNAQLAEDRDELMQAEQRLLERNEQLCFLVEQTYAYIASLQLEIQALEAQRQFNYQRFTEQRRTQALDVDAVQQVCFSLNARESEIRLNDYLQELKLQLVQSNNEIYVATLTTLSDELRTGYDRQLRILRQRAELLEERLTLKRSCPTCRKNCRKIAKMQRQLEKLQEVNCGMRCDVAFVEYK